MANGTRPRGRRRERLRRPKPVGAAAWMIVGATLLLCFLVVPRLRETPDLSRITKRALSLEDGGGGGGGSLLHIPYESMFEATPPALQPLCLAFFVLVLLFLFCSISITASDFFCPNLASMAAFLGLSETTAGVTLLAFGNGSPDVFSTFVAMREGTFGLAAGELIGAATFITSIVVGSIAMVQPFQVPRYPFLRDIAFFMVAVVMFMWTLADGHLTLRESGAMIGLYVVYVIVVVGGNWWQHRQRRKEEYAQLGWKTIPRDEERAAPPVENADALLVPSPTSPGFVSPHFSAGRFGRRASSASFQLAAQEAAEARPMPQSAHWIDDESDAPRAAFSLLGAVEFRDVVNSLKQSGDLPSPGSSRFTTRPSTPLRSPLHESADSDYFHSHRTKHHRHSSIQGLAAVERRVSVTRTRSGSLHPAWSNRPTRQSTLEEPSELSPVSSSPPQPSSDRDVEHIPLSASPRNKHKLTLDIPQREATALVARTSPPATASTVWSRGGSAGASAMTPADVPQIAVQNEDGGEEAPVMAPSRTQTVELAARHGLNKLSVILHTLFPSLQGFHHKSLLGMGLAVLSVPAIFILTLTLPVTDDGRTDEGGIALPGADDEPLADATGDDDDDRRVAPEVSGDLHHLVHSDFPHRRWSVDDETESSCSACSDEDDCMVFNPVLTAAQCIFGPVVCGYLVFQDEPYLRWVLLGAGVAGAVVAVAVLKLATDGTSQPWRLIRCCCGFICSMVWIGTIADEVVSVLMTFGEIFGLSDAIIGLTIFAIGNSLADLVANVTIAQFSPNMAYAACFGGPMLNLLLGVGAGGSYSILWSRSHTPVMLDFSPTLWVSAVGLVIVLATTAVVVPLNKYRIDKRWALCLLIAYATLMTVNVVVEIRSERRGGKGDA
ncbi:hypothetical protein CcaverHIS002_0509760 [Cutaneotrichosporon cavernicola]|uniref:Sodium/calcium exchanger membrane region domain-containing protein n=1 Tax=Cutaneotrichosporon cavernicola TaxID=279322 RepID=A0AA48L7P2_9TREE|nr:uncharacterized protein CcaverHIS019_0510310 [Cutaneotrichosporon cavernicola]BEI85575.1 hypothetical protein CcaverHIS002_0509760 [Cutaneotrichosporon cavernicola]BEI93403.1 hypothetical protein CcaverHIS019_0510310 [Cutaneotrichosporon cavernicola]BEJ01181.1 hypothetical protein CcaverHIS631_0510380 [Cutaneotrichosporon cavernicola]BEJ08949.1 hypothetical protein CcaverHIS641_0510430 [Cutaneotrichosporon cavernicola]